QKASAATSMKGPHVPSNVDTAPARTADAPPNARSSLERSPIVSPGQPVAEAYHPAELQKRASWLVPPSAIQKWIPSLHAPLGFVAAPVGKLPIVVRSAAFQSATLLPLRAVTRTRCPSKAAA